MIYVFIVAGYLIGMAATFFICAWTGFGDRYNDGPPWQIVTLAWPVAAVIASFICIIVPFVFAWKSINKKLDPNKLYKRIGQIRIEREDRKERLRDAVPPILVREGGDYRNAPSDVLANPKPKRFVRRLMDTIKGFVLEDGG